MRYRLLDRDDAGAKTWVVVLATGDETLASLQEFAEREHVSAAHFSAIGAFRRAVLGYFEWERKDYRRNVIDTQVEVVSLIGDVALDGDQRALHMHAVLGARDGRALGGHLLEGHVRPTLEVMLTESPAHLHRRHDDETGLALIRPDSGQEDTR
jgi:uncharacterized protein